MFGRDSSMAKELAKLDVLESKLAMYESLSREMLDKLENAVDKISESNQRIATILVKHDERIDQATRSDELIIKMIDEVKRTNTNEHMSVINRIDKIERSIDDLSKFRWQVGAVAGLAVLVVGFLTTVVTPFIDNMLPPQYNDRSKTALVNELH
jgi:hypothetical protein